MLNPLFIFYFYCRVFKGNRLCRRATVQQQAPCMLINPIFLHIVYPAQMIPSSAKL